MKRNVPSSQNEKQICNHQRIGLVLGIPRTPSIYPEMLALKPQYIMEPCAQQLIASQMITNSFRVSYRNTQIQWNGRIDFSKLSIPLQYLIILGDNFVEVYPDQLNQHPAGNLNSQVQISNSHPMYMKPNIGYELNRKCVAKFSLPFRVSRDKLARICRDNMNNCELVGISEDAHDFLVQIQHFTKYEFSNIQEDDEDNQGLTEEEIKFNSNFQNRHRRSPIQNLNNIRDIEQTLEQLKNKSKIIQQGKDDTAVDTIQQSDFIKSLISNNSKLVGQNSAMQSNIIQFIKDKYLQNQHQKQFNIKGQESKKRIHNFETLSGITFSAIYYLLQYEFKHNYGIQNISKTNLGYRVLEPTDKLHSDIRKYNKNNHMINEEIVSGILNPLGTGAQFSSIQCPGKQQFIHLRRYETPKGCHLDSINLILELYKNPRKLTDYILNQSLPLKNRQCLALYGICFRYKYCEFIFEREQRMDLEEQKKTIQKKITLKRAHVNHINFYTKNNYNQMSMLKDCLQWMILDGSQGNLQQSMKNIKNKYYKYLCARKTQDLTNKLLEFGRYEEAEFVSNIEDPCYRHSIFKDKISMGIELSSIFQENFEGISQHIPNSLITNRIHWFLQYAMLSWYYPPSDHSTILIKRILGGVQDEKDYSLELYILRLFNGLNIRDLYKRQSSSSIIPLPIPNDSELGWMWFIRNNLQQQEHNYFKIYQNNQLEYNKNRYLLLLKLVNNIMQQIKNSQSDELFQNKKILQIKQLILLENRVHQHKKEHLLNKLIIQNSYQRKIQHIQPIQSRHNSLSINEKRSHLISTSYYPLEVHFAKWDFLQNLIGISVYCEIVRLYQINRLIQVLNKIPELYSHLKHVKGSQKIISIKQLNDLTLSLIQRQELLLAFSVDIVINTLQNLEQLITELKQIQFHKIQGQCSNVNARSFQTYLENYCIFLKIKYHTLSSTQLVTNSDIEKIQMINRLFDFGSQLSKQNLCSHINNIAYKYVFQDWDLQAIIKKSVDPPNNTKINRPEKQYLTQYNKFYSKLTQAFKEDNKKSSQIKMARISM